MKRHYCILCGKKRQERFMEFIEIAINNRGRWQCKPNTCDEEHRRYGKEWRSWT